MNHRPRAYESPALPLSYSAAVQDLWILAHPRQVDSDRPSSGHRDRELPPPKVTPERGRLFGVNLFGEILRTFGWSVRVRRTAIVKRIQHLTTVAVYLGSIGTAIGYAVATRRRVDPDADDDPGEAE